MFLGSALVALGLVALAPRLAGEGGALPAWGFLFFVVAIDVAHVWSTLYRTYLDRRELERRPALYAGVPIACFLVGAVLHGVSSGLFWTVLAYVALTHFVRQQVGWVAIYRARARASRADAGSPVTTLDRVIDDAAIYVGALYPVLVWHASLPRAFHWFVEGDFVPADIGALLPIARALWLGGLLVYVARAVQLAVRTRRVELGKHIVVGTTAVTWYVGIVATNSDFTFTAANVIVHGVPYIALLWMYARENAKGQDRGPLLKKLVAYGLPFFIVSLQLLAFCEEMIWDRLVWHSNEGLFGWASGERMLSDRALALLVPLLAVPQATHYVLDAVLWRRRDTGAAQARAIGFATAPSPSRTP